MKKYIALMLFACLLICLCACDITSTPPVYEVNGETDASMPTFEKAPRPAEVTHHRKDETEEPTESTEDAALSTVYTNAFSYRDTNGIIRAIGIVQVTNHADVSLSLPICTMTFSDDSGSVVYTSDSVAAYPPVIAPEESAYYYEQFEPDLPDVCTISLSADIPEPVSAEPIRYEIGEIAMNDSPYGGLVLNSTVTNTTQENGEVVCVAAVLFDKSNTPLAVVRTVLMEPLPAGQSSAFYIEDFLLPTDLTSDSVASVQAYAYPL